MFWDKQSQEEVTKNLKYVLGQAISRRSDESKVSGQDI